tara:strand:- start:20479 stop:20799 length:321 start_codon:yes stop_codon:yes gene_type:complete
LESGTHAAELNENAANGLRQFEDFFRRSIEVGEDAILIRTYQGSWRLLAPSVSGAHSERGAPSRHGAGPVFEEFVAEPKTMTEGESANPNPNYYLMRNSLEATNSV